ncbi:hypothetical protein Syun_027228 [Stephania yunnanensis]|uniref:Secreted protein n=1 Tax=Stephania yunnanensis TaxID=152371 RepID=A0AAP0EIL3_9MAGN
MLYWIVFLVLVCIHLLQSTYYWRCSNIGKRNVVIKFIAVKMNEAYKNRELTYWNEFHLKMMFALVADFKICA